MLSLGGIVFESYALPEHVPLGGEHHFVVHKLIGGDRVINAMGRDDSDISWSGRLQRPDAVEVAQSIDQLRISGQAVPLIVDSQMYTVGVHKFEWDYERFYQILYKITCLVISSQGGNIAVESLDTLISSDLSLISANLALL